ncbi:MAG TPA: UvrD-helicase domain-containing protein [Rhodospirillales bacterium]
MTDMSPSTDPFDLGRPPAEPAAQGRAWYLDNLNESQRRAVEVLDGPVLVLAGAGTGKTRVLTTRLAHLLVEGRASSWEVLAVTFTNKAASEMKERVAKLLQRPVEGWWVGTFHAIGARILRAHAEAAGLKPNFTILDADDQVRLVKQLMESRDIDEKRWPARVLAAQIQRWKDRGLGPDKVSEAEGAAAAEGQVLPLYAEYQERLRVLNAADFGDLLLHCLTVFQKHPEILARYQKQFRYLMVDEYQDTNVAQYLWLRLLAQTHRNICCVGDDDQSIYSWRGAEVENILRFEKDFAGAQVIRLERNYRSTPHILAAASGLIAHNEGRLGKTLWTEVNEGEKVRVRGIWDGEEEARVTGEEIEALHTKKHALNQMAVLVRAGFQTREFEERLITLGVPYRVIGGPRFYERQEIRDAIAYLRVIAQPDDDLAFERIINVPKRGLGPATLQTLHRLARAERIPLVRSGRRLVETDEIKPQARNTLRRLLEDFERWRMLAETVLHSDLAAQVLDESGYTAMWRESKAVDAAGRLENVKEMIVALEDFDTLAAFLEHVSLVMENDDPSVSDKVNLMTLHGAKGLEFDTVFLAGWEEDLFPHPRTLDEGGTAGLEEERRLAYVGLTRARKRAIISFAANRRIHGQWKSSAPSRFIDELPPDHVDVRSEAGLYGGRGGLGGELADVGSAFSGRPRGRRHLPRTIEDVTWRVAERADADGAFRVGERVFHQKFGYGRVVAVDGGKLEIAFEKAGSKKVMASFVESV